MIPATSILDSLSVKNKRLIARIISLIEAGDFSVMKIQRELFNKTGKAYKIGITGPPGAGKSTITNRLIKHLLSLSKTVAVIAVDPTSPFSGGALLGDRVRMNDIGISENIFIRSVATRGSLGGLSKKTIDIGDVFDAAGFDYLIFETVGVGQSELDIAKIADTTIVTLVPESGDSIQAMKAGLMEIADIFVLNKADRPGADRAMQSLKTTLELHKIPNGIWKPPVLQTIAVDNVGIVKLMDTITNHRNYCFANKICNNKRLEYFKERVLNIIETTLKKNITEKQSEIFNTAVKEGIENKISPYIIAERILMEYNG